MPCFPPMLGRFLLLGGLALMTPACGEDYDTYVELREPSGMHELSASEPVGSRRFRMVAAAKPDTRAKVAWPYLSLNVGRRWSNPDASSAEVVYPWLRVRLVDESDGAVLDEDVVVFDEQGLPREENLANSPGRDDRAERFDVTYRLEFERQGTPSDGVIKVFWNTYASVSSSGDRDEVEFTVTEQP
ncbi:hypothetical protein [Corallococcus sp. CA047B]|uniref:hypothetical protein n=1 Tax=Corallococcus sp. CA047B TaxID=2316729 RepID=UPI0011C3F802|nr:hypothetical protein [Corallococcus sp. CA047B]